MVGNVSKVSATAVDGEERGFLSRAVGECYSVEVEFGTVQVPCLLDPGSQVTTVGAMTDVSFTCRISFKYRIPLPDCSDFDSRSHFSTTGNVSCKCCIPM